MEKGEEEASPTGYRNGSQTKQEGVRQPSNIQGGPKIFKTPPSGDALLNRETAPALAASEASKITGCSVLADYRSFGSQLGGAA